VKIGDAEWLEGLRNAVAPRCDTPPLAVGLLWAVGLESAINKWALRRASNAAAFDSGDVGLQHSGLRGMPDASGLATHVALAVTNTAVRAFEPNHEMSMLGRVKPPTVKKDLGGWERAGLTVSVGAPSTARLMGHKVEGRPVTLEVPATGERHELTIGVSLADDQFLAVLTQG